MKAITNVDELPADLKRFIPEQRTGQLNDTFSSCNKRKKMMPICFFMKLKKDY